MSDQWRVQFDAEVTFRNGGRLAAEGFRLDVDSPDIREAELAGLFVRELGLLMVDEVRIRNRTKVKEPHKGSRTRAEGARGERRRLVELSHAFGHGTVTYPGLPAPEITDHLTREASRARYAEGVEFSIARISMVANTGTYLDSPFHRFADGADLSRLPLASVADLDGVVVRVAGTARRDLDRSVLEPHSARGRAVLVHTGWDRHWGTEAYGVDAPFLTEDAARWLVDQGAALVGIDSVNIDDTGDLRRPAHSLLLAAGIPIVEHLCGLEQLPPSGFRVYAAPPLVAGMGTFPVRAFAVIGG